MYVATEICKYLQELCSNLHETSLISCSYFIQLYFWVQDVFQIPEKEGFSLHAVFMRTVRTTMFFLERTVALDLTVRKAFSETCSALAQSSATVSDSFMKKGDIYTHERYTNARPRAAVRPAL